MGSSSPRGPSLYAILQDRNKQLIKFAITRSYLLSFFVIQRIEKNNIKLGIGKPFDLPSTPNYILLSKSATFSAVSASGKLTEFLNLLPAFSGK